MKVYTVIEMATILGKRSF